LKQKILKIYYIINYNIFESMSVFLSWQEVKQEVKENTQEKNISIFIKKGEINLFIIFIKLL
ncbi:unnamed protein product, partial [marine sediment metagenome]